MTNALYEALAGIQQDHSDDSRLWIAVADIGRLSKSIVDRKGHGDSRFQETSANVAVEP